MSQITAGRGDESVIIFIFRDMTRQISEMGRQGYLMEKMIRDLRAPITNLNAAVENMNAYPEMEEDIRREFEEIILRESRELTQRFDSIVSESEKVIKVQWPLFDVYSADLIGCVVGRFTGTGVKVTMTGVPLWLKADSYSMMLTLERLAQLVNQYCNITEMDMEVLLGDRRVYIDIVWEGEPIPQSEVDTMLTQPLPEAMEEITVGDVLARHDSEMWSQKHRRQGFSLLRIPVPDSPRQWQLPPEPLPESPEFYDFSLAERRVELGEMADKPLRSLNYVVFDTETTGLRPSEGDEILSIAAVRIVNMRILSGERFERLIKPERPIPESSLPFLDISEEMLRDELPAQAILPKFRAFADDAVLVAHNGAFDMHFFREKEQESGVSFDNPLLDTLLLAMVVDGDQEDHTLEGLGRLLGVNVSGDRTTMDDCFVVAEIFLELLELLERKGLRTLGDVIAATDRLVEEKRRQRK